MIRREEIELFVNKKCKIILSNGFNYQGFLKKIENSNVFFEDRIDGLKIIDASIIKSISEVGGENGRRME